MDDEKRKGRRFVMSRGWEMWIGLAAFSALALVMFIIDKGSSFAQVALLVIGTAALVLIVGHLALALKENNLSAHPFAFGLPNGSIRAFIAIGLLIAFVAGSVFLYAGIGQPVVVAVGPVLSSPPPPSSLSEGFIVLQIADGAEETPKQWQVFSVSPLDARQEFAQQVLTTLATALAAVIGFYFGNRASAAPSEQFTIAAQAQAANSPAINAAREKVIQAQNARSTIINEINKHRQNTPAAKQDKVAMLIYTRKLQSLERRLASADEAVAAARKALSALEDSLVRSAQIVSVTEKAQNVEQAERATTSLEKASAGAIANGRLVVSAPQR